MTGVTVRLVTDDDVAALTALAVANREHLAPFVPTPPESSFTDAGQRAALHEVLERFELGLAVPFVIVDSDGSIAGRINLNSITRGAAQSASVGYWVSHDRLGRGIATAALRRTLEIGFGELGLHRVQGETLPGNLASQVVLERNGFQRIGFAPQLLHIAGAWRDHVIYQRLAPAR